MSLKILVERSHKGPGSFVNGTVTAKSRAWKRMCLTRLIGRSKVKVLEDTGLDQEVHESSSTFLKMEEKMYEHPVMHQDGWVSAFIIPLCSKTAEYLHPTSFSRGPDTRGPA